MPEDRATVKRMIVVIRDSLVDLVGQLNLLLSELDDQKAPSTKLVSPEGDVLAEVYEGENTQEFVIASKFLVPLRDATVQNFFVKKILDTLKPKNVTYQLEEQDGKLARITLTGNITQEDLQTVRKTLAWTLRKVGQRGANNEPDRNY